MSATSRILISTLGFIFAASALSACGDDEPKRDYASISKSVSSLTGKLTSAEDAKSVALAFKDHGGSFSLGYAAVGYGQGDVTQACPAGGEIVVNGSGNQNSGSASVDYNNCCYAADCCANGEAKYYYSNAAAPGEFTFCGNWDLSVQCGRSTASASYDGCVGPEGYWYVVEVNGGTFAVNGSFDGVNGNWTVKTAEGTWTCEATAGAGSCTNGTNTITWN